MSARQDERIEIGLGTAASLGSKSLSGGAKINRTGTSKPDAVARSSAE